MGGFYVLLALVALISVGVGVAAYFAMRAFFLWPR
jgi:hypothetical protein